MINFLLVPDSSSALFVRRLVASAGGRMNLVVGTWPELLFHASNSHLLPPPTDDWAARLDEGVAKLDGAFWSRSYRNVKESERQAVASIVGKYLAMLLEAAGPAGSLTSVSASRLSPRLQRHVDDFCLLHATMGSVLPAELQRVRQILQAGPGREMRRIAVCRIDQWPRLSPWQAALVDHLNASVAVSGRLPDPSLPPILEAAVFKPSGEPGSSLRFMQENLFRLPEKRAWDRRSLQWLAVRDHLQEVEVAAGMIREAIRHGGGAEHADFGLLLPQDDRYCRAVRSVFTMAGIPVSGLAVEAAVRDLGREAVLHLLECLDKPAPLMALASLLASPLMPWGADEGNRLAQKVMESRFNLEAPAGSREKGRKMLALILDGVKSPAELVARLTGFAGLLDRSEALAMHRERAAGLCAELIARLEGPGGFIPWAELRSMAAPQKMSAAPDTSRVLEGVALFSEGREPWRNVKHLIVLGCSSGHFPATDAGNGIFTDADLRELREKAGFAVETSEERNARQRSVFLRQIAAATVEATFFVPRRDAFGKPLEPSASLAFATALFDGVEKPGDLLLDLESASYLDKTRGVPRSDGGAADGATLSIEDPDLGTDLLRLCPAADGKTGSETPSRLETLLVSPLAWLLDRLRIKPQEWRPETFDAMAKGTLAHAVFEHLFAPGAPLPEEEALKGRVAELLGTAIDRSCPFLRRDEWKVEAGHLEQEVLKAARRWGAMLKEIGARVAAAEIELEGVLDGRPINGKADLLLELDGGRLVVVDYKKSGSGTRKKRMEAGYDLQAELYRRMIRSGGVREGKGIPEEVASFVNRFRNAGEVGTLYYLMNNQVALSDTDGWFRDIGGLEEIHGEVSANALQELAASLRELESGFLRLNSASDAEELYKQKGLSAYALELPLVRVFMKPAVHGAECGSTEVADA